MINFLSVYGGGGSESSHLKEKREPLAGMGGDSGRWARSGEEKRAKGEGHTKE